MDSAASASAPSRFITAFPDGNTGALVYFIPVNGTGNSTLQTSLNLTSVTSSTGSDNQTGLQGEISVSSDLTFGVTLSTYLSRPELRASRKCQDTAGLRRIWRKGIQYHLQLYSRIAQCVVSQFDPSLDQRHYRTISHF